MSETSTAVEHADDEVPAFEQPPFAQAELEQFDADDIQAGRAIGTMLAWIFLYTIVVMSLAAWWTYSAIAE